MSETLVRRARSLAEMGPMAGKMFVDAEIGAAVGGFRPRPTDVIISPFAKCGTTWLQQTFHCLRTGGDMDFDDISRVVPWIETSTALEIDLTAEQRAGPRGFKSHLAYREVPKGGRYIVALRDPRDALVSMYRFMDGWFLEPGAVSIEEFAPMRIGVQPDGHDYWSHLLSWWAERDNPDVLLLSYEHMTADPEWAVRKVAGFCGLPLSDALLALTLERSSLAFMLAHKDRFDDAMMRRLSEVRCNLPPGGDSAKVRKGGVGGHRQELPAEIIKALDDTWTSAITPVLGFADYASLEAELRQRAAV
jgi:hypothetical protein